MVVRIKVTSAGGVSNRLLSNKTVCTIQPTHIQTQNIHVLMGGA